jgi:two-component system, chemotaxis family, sensor kinase CheA
MSETNVPPERRRPGVGVKTKLFGLILGTAVAALIASCLAFVLYDRQSYRDAKHATLTVLAAAIAEGAYGPAAFGDAESARFILGTVSSEATTLGGAIYGTDGQLLAEWSRAGSGATMPKVVPPPQEGSKVMEIRRAVAKDQNQVGTLVLRFSTADIEARTRRFVSIAAGVLGAATLLATLVVLFAHGVFTGPIGRLADAALKVQAEGDFQVRVKRSSDDELGLLTDAFNGMLSAIQERDAELTAHRVNLEQLVQTRTEALDRRNQAMRLVLDTVEQGLATVDLLGRLLPERSRQFDAWFAAQDGELFGRAIDRLVPGFRERFEMAFDQVGEGILPLEIAIDQLPRRIETKEGRFFALDYRPSPGSGSVERVLIVVSDVTSEEARQLAERNQKQVLAMFEHVSRDRTGFVDFLTEADAIAGKIVGGDLERIALLRALHTLKGNCSLFGLKAVADQCHELEDALAETGGGLSEAQKAHLRAAWNEVLERARLLLGDVADHLAVPLVDYDELLTAVRNFAPGTALVGLVERLAFEPVAPRLERLGAQANSLAQRLGIAEFRLRIEANGIRLPGNWGWLWALLPHLIRNALDHGLRAKEGAAELRITARLVDRAVHFVVADNGVGINWEAIRAAACDRDLPHESREDLVRALFADSVSSRSEVSETSGRGVGMAAVHQEVRAHGGTIEVASEPKRGTAFTLVLPLQLSPDAASRASIQLRSLLPPDFGSLRVSA